MQAGAMISHIVRPFRMMCPDPWIMVRSLYLACLSAGCSPCFLSPPKCLSTDKMAWLVVSEIPYWRISSQMEEQICPSGRLSAYTPSSSLLGSHETSMNSSEFCFLKLYHLSQIRVGVSCQVSPSVLCYFPCCCWVK